MPDTDAPPPECLFCAYDRPDLNRVLAQNTTCYARYDNYPAAPGHVEVAPKRHVESFFGLTAQESVDALALLAHAKDLVAAEHPCDGYTIGVNEGRAAGRTIDHVHIHLIPRTAGDVPDPRGGVRMVVSARSPDEWIAARTPGAEPQSGGDYIATTSPAGVDYDLTRPLVDAHGDWWHAVGHLTVAGHPSVLLISTAAGTWPADIDPDCLLSLPDILEAGYGPLTSAPASTETSAT